jgi:hypothetical protein
MSSAPELSASSLAPSIADREGSLKSVGQRIVLTGNIFSPPFKVVRIGNNGGYLVMEHIDTVFDEPVHGHVRVHGDR